jgi:hypothetical protein
MTKFELVKKATNKLRTTFHVLGAGGDIVGSINVAPSEEADLLRHWNGPAGRPQARGAVGRAPMLSVRMNRAAVLRGC